MKLSVELFEQTVQQLKGEGVSDRDERRAAPRIGLRARIQLIPIVSGVIGKPIEVWTRDISRLGLGIICSKKMKVGSQYLLALPREEEGNEDKAMALLCTARCVHLLAPDIYATGFSFEDMRTKHFPSAPAATAEGAAGEL